MWISIGFIGLYLHSNMELLLPSTYMIDFMLFHDLHSNMELLLREELVKNIEDSMIYIPIWSYFYQYIDAILNANKFIYIPIWSYFYFQLLILYVFFLLHLHSNMELLLPIKAHFFKLFYPYLHSNMELLLL